MKKMPVKFLLVLSGIILLLILLMQPFEVWHFREYIAVLFPDGAIAVEQRNLLLIIQVIMLLIIIPVFILTFIFSWRYRAEKGNKATYDPDLIDNRLAEVLWWGIPIVATAVIAVLTWVKTYELDPFKPLQSDKKPLTVQVVALQWKWLFVYPEEKIATVNFVQIPKDVPIHFEITADAPMNSFWIPNLAGQIYAMPNMKTELNLIANNEGDFPGYSANISGEGFAGMHFVTRASSGEEYQQWIQSVQQSNKMMNIEQYNQLVAPSQNNPVELFRLQDEKLFDFVLMKYMHPHE